MRICFLLLYIFYFYGYGFAQQDKKVDSIMQALGKSREDTNKVNILNDLSKYYTNSDASKALSYAHQALDISGKINWVPGKMNSCNSLGRAYYVLFDDKAMFYFKEGQKWAKAAHNKKMEGYITGNVGLVFAQKYENDSALHYYTEALKIDRQGGYKQSESKVLANTGLLYRAMSDFPKSLEYFLEALKINKETGDENQGATLHYIGIVYEDMGDNQNALKYSLQASKLLDKQGNKFMQAQNYSELGVIYADLDSLSTALEYDKKAYSLNMEVGNKQAAAIILTNTGGIYKDKKEYITALGYFQRSLNMATEVGDKYGQATALEFMSGTYTELHDYKNVIAYGKEAVRLSKEINDKEREESAWQNLSYSYEKMNQPALALDAYKKSIALRDSIVNVDKQKEITRKQMQFDFDMKQAKYHAAQEKRDAIAKEQLENQELERNAIIGGGAFFVLLSGILFFGYRRNRNKNILLKAKNEMIGARDKEKELLLRELHHRVKNNLQIVSSLLRLQSKQLKDENAIFAIQDSRNRVEAMSLIHQNLYQKDVLTDISIREFINSLIANISSTYGTDPEKMRLDLDIENIVVHVEIAIPLGLILNELICNAYKHAFADIANPRLELVLKESGQGILVIIKDNGVGMPKDFDIKTSKSFGMDLVDSLVKQLHGTLKLSSVEGTGFEIFVSKYKTPV